MTARNGSRSLTIALMALVLAVAPARAARAQHHGSGSGQSSGHSGSHTSSGGAHSGGSGGSRSSGGGQRGTSTAPAAARAVPRNDPGASSASGATPPHAGASNGKPTVGTAVPREPGSAIRGGVIGPGGYYGGYFYPWWYGIGYTGLYAGYYDPWYGGYPGVWQSAPSWFDDAKIRLKIKPRDAEVYLDGYYVGVVDDFDGIFQRLHVEPGPHHIEVRAPGYEPLVVDLRVTADHTVTYDGRLTKIQ